jgi:6-phosphofructokinase 1
MKRIAVLTSGGDAPGMNAAIRAVTRCALEQGWEVFGVRRGYAGLVAGHFQEFTARSVGGIIQRELRQRDIGGLVVIGGNGSQTGAYALSQMDFPVVGVASTIDNDLVGSDITIGVDTALNIALESIDRLKITASSHMRAFLVEVMGRKSGYLALMTAIAGGAEVVVVPEIETTPEQVAQGLRAAYERGKAHALVVVAEGAKYNADSLVSFFKEHSARVGFDLRSTTLGHVQRGGAPTAYDRILATRLGAGAVTALVNGEESALVGMLKGSVTATPLREIVGVQKPIDPELLNLARVLDK